MKQLRQGDILLEALDISPPAHLVAKSEVILAEGELTGHAHRLKASEIYEWEVEGQRYIRCLGEKGELSHEDHDPVPVRVIEPDVTYRIIPQQETDLFNVNQIAQRFDDVDGDPLDDYRIEMLVTELKKLGTSERRGHQAAGHVCVLYPHQHDFDILLDLAVEFMADGKLKEENPNGAST